MTTEIVILCVFCFIAGLLIGGGLWDAVNARKMARCDFYDGELGRLIKKGEINIKVNLSKDDDKLPPDWWATT